MNTETRCYHSMSVAKLIDHLLTLIRDAPIYATARTRLTAIRDGIFLELPETRTQLLCRVGAVINECVPSGRENDRIEEFWYEIRDILEQAFSSPSKVTMPTTRPAECETVTGGPRIVAATGDAINARIEEALDSIHGPRETYRPLLNPLNILSRICRTAELRASREGVEPWSIIGDITGHGSGVANAIYKAYRDESS